MENKRLETTGTFASIVNSVVELPEPLQRAFSEQVAIIGEAQFTIFNPAFQSTYARTPATVLGITDRSWFMLQRDEDEHMTVQAGNFNDTLLLEFGIILLHGHLKIDYAQQGSFKSAQVEFNTVMQEMFHRAAKLIINGIENTGSRSLLSSECDPRSALANWPLKFLNASLLYLPEDHAFQRGTQWSTVLGGFKRELAPAGALLLTDRELILITDEKAPAGAKDWTLSHLGEIVTYIPLERLTHFHVTPHDRLGTLTLQIRAGEGIENLTVLIPGKESSAIRQVMGEALARD